MKNIINIYEHNNIKINDYKLENNKNLNEQDSDSNDSAVKQWDISKF